MYEIKKGILNYTLKEGLIEVRNRSFEKFFFTIDGRIHCLAEIQREYESKKGDISKFKGFMRCPECRQAELGFTHRTRSKREYLSKNKTAKHAKNCSYINDYIRKLRGKADYMEVIEKNERTSRVLISKLKEKKIYALFSDHRDKGAIVNFFGKETKAPSGAISMALKFDMPFVLVYNTFNEDNTITVYVTDEIELKKTGNFKEDVQNNVQYLINIMEDVIRKYPEQWMWFHDRWNNFREYKKSLKNREN